jgi:exo-beta-1,3-glucanase (GH17 family)
LTTYGTGFQAGDWRTITGDESPLSTKQITAMIRYAKAQMAPNGDFAGLTLSVGARANRFREADATSSDPNIRRFSQDVGALVAAADFLMENVYPSAQALEAARRDGDWEVYFKPDTGELTNQWRQFRGAVDGLAAGKRLELMIGEIGHPTNGIAFNLPGYVEDTAAIRPDSAFARIATALDASGSALAREGIEVFQDYCNTRLASAFVREVAAWSRATGVQIHVFEAFDEPHKAAPNVPPPNLRLAQSNFSQSGPYGAEDSYGLFGYTGVADFQAKRPGRDACRPGSKPKEQLPSGVHWAAPFEGRFYPKRPELDFGKLARSFEAVISP